MKGHPAVRPTVDEFLGSLDQLNRASAEFLKIDLETALTFVSIARQTHDEVRKKRNCLAAHRAYDTVKKLSRKVTLNDQDSRLITQSLTQLRLELLELGHTV